MSSYPQEQLAALHHDETAEEKLETERRSLEQQLRTTRETVDALQARLANIEFTFSDPEKGFDRSKVRLKRTLNM